MSISFDTLTALASAITLVAGTVAGANFSIHKFAKAEIKDIANEMKEIRDKEYDSILDLIKNNTKEMKEYYIINKRHATMSFYAALFVSFLGFLLFALGIAFQEKDNLLIFSTIAGTIVELISGLFFWLYNKSITQLNIFHERLSNSEKFLTAIELVEKVSDAEKDNTYKELIRMIFKE